MLVQIVQVTSPRVMPRENSLRGNQEEQAREKISAPRELKNSWASEYNRPHAADICVADYLMHANVIFISLRACRVVVKYSAMEGI